MWYMDSILNAVLDLFQSLKLFRFQGVYGCNTNMEFRCIGFQGFVFEGLGTGG